MRSLGKPPEFTKKKGEFSMFQRDILSLKNELREIDMLYEGGNIKEDTSKQKPRRHLPKSLKR